MPRRKPEEELSEYDRLPKYLKLNQLEREQIQTLHRFGHDTDGKVAAYNYLFPEKAEEVEDISKVKWWSMKFAYKHKAKDAYIDTLVAGELKEHNVSRENVTMKVLKIAIKAEKKGDLKTALECHKFIARMQGYVRDRQINVAQFPTTIEIHHEPLSLGQSPQISISSTPVPDENIFNFFDVESQDVTEIPEKNIEKDEKGEKNINI